MSVPSLVKEDMFLRHWGWKEVDVNCGGLEKEMGWWCGSYGEGEAE